MYKTTEHLEDKIGENPSGFGFGDDFSDKTPKARSIEEKLISRASLKFSNFCSAKDTV